MASNFAFDPRMLGTLAGGASPLGLQLGAQDASVIPQLAPSLGVGDAAQLSSGLGLPGASLSAAGFGAQRQPVFSPQSFAPPDQGGTPDANVPGRRDFLAQGNELAANQAVSLPQADPLSTIQQQALKDEIKKEQGKKKLDPNVLLTLAQLGPGATIGRLIDSFR